MGRYDSPHTQRKFVHTLPCAIVLALANNRFRLQYSWSHVFVALRWMCPPSTQRGTRIQCGGRIHSGNHERSNQIAVATMRDPVHYASRSRAHAISDRILSAENSIVACGSHQRGCITGCGLTGVPLCKAAGLLCPGTTSRFPGTTIISCEAWISL